VCRRSDGNGFSVKDVKQTIRCGVDHWRVSGGVHKAMSIARCESGFHPHANNSTSSAKGVYQFLDSTWSSVKRHYRALARRWSLSHRVFNGRANVVLAVKLAHGSGWGSWSCS
jgi:hypothetical protein